MVKYHQRDVRIMGSGVKESLIRTISCWYRLWWFL